MPRLARKKSETGIYHIMLRGIDKRDIFMSKWDYGKFLEYIKKAKDKSAFQVFGYCLMTNHVHMLLKTEMDDIGDIIKRIAVGYAQYHNIRNGRTGHLFQNRFRSEVVDTEAYFLTVLRYIHQNPVKAGMVKDVKVYKWSSYIEYIDNSKNLLVDAAFALGFFPDISL
ncbi:MAG: transposase [Lutispora sp.]